MNEDIQRRAVAEFIGSFALTFIWAGSIITIAVVGSGSLLAVAVASGLVLAIFVSAFGHISGAHFNPAITLGFLVTKRITTDLAIVYWIAQFAGGIVAALMLRVVYEDKIVDSPTVALGAPRLGNGTEWWEGIFIEIILTFFLAVVVFATAVDPRGAFRYIAGFAIGLTISADILMGGPLTGAAMNPQRALGPQLLSWTWTDAWIYYVAPPIGAVLAAVLYDRVYLRGREVAVAGSEESGLDQEAIRRATED